MPTDTLLPIDSEGAIVNARQHGRALAGELGFSMGDTALITTAISEIARNILTYAGSGEMLLSPVQDGRRRGILVVGRDDEPGIENIELAMRDGYSTSRSLGMGLPGSRRLMDEFQIVSEVGKGTEVTMKKWVT